MSIHRLLHRSRFALLCIGAAMSSSLLGMNSVQEKVDATIVQAMQKMREYVGAFDFKAKLDMSAVGQPGVKTNFTGTAKSQFVLDSTGILTVTEVDNKQSLNYTGFRTDTNDYYNVNMDSNQTALNYMAGKYIKPNVMKLTEPINRTTAETVFGKDGASTTTIRVPPNQAVFMEIENTKVGKVSGDVLKQLISGPIKPARINRKTDSPNPGENYTRAHLLLQKLAGNFSTDDGYKVASRMVGEGRYLLTYVSEPAEYLIFTSYNSAGKFFQQITVGSELPLPMYLQGPLQEDGSISMSDPFNPNGIKAVITFEPNGDYSTTTSMGGQVVAERTWRLKK